jgi:hypothetical protein
MWVNNRVIRLTAPEYREASIRTPSGVCTKEGARAWKEEGSLDPVGAIGSTAVRVRIDRGLLPRQLRSIYGACVVRVNVTYSQLANTSTPSTVYTHILHNQIQISEITPFGPLCKTSKSPLDTSFLYRQSIYAIFTT